MQLPPVQMTDQDGDAGMETLLWEFNIIPNDLAMYLMLPPGVLHMSALGCFGRFTLFSPRVSHSNTCRLLSHFVICWLDQDGESSARIHLADDPLSGLNEEAHVVGNGTENCDPHRVADNRQ